MASHGIDYEVELLYQQEAMATARERMGKITEAEWRAKLREQMEEVLENAGVSPGVWGDLTDADWFRIPILRDGVPTLGAFLRWRDAKHGQRDAGAWGDLLEYFQRPADPARGRRRWPRWAISGTKGITPKTPLIYKCARCRSWQLPSTGALFHRCFCCGFAPT